MKYIILFLFLSAFVIFKFIFVGCSTQPHTEVKYVSGVANCSALTQGLIEYTRQQAKDFFGDDVDATITVQDIEVLSKYGLQSNWSYEGIVVACGTTEELCGRLMHEWGRQEAWNRFHYKGVVEAEQIFPVFYQSWQNWPCVPAIMQERGFAN